MQAASDPRFHGDEQDEILSLIESLGRIEQRLETLTAGEIDTVSNSQGHTFLLRRAQEKLRRSEAVKQAAILDVVPAYIALIDTKGKIVSINAAWRASTTMHPLLGPGYDVEFEYLGMCDEVSSDAVPEAARIAAGIRAVLGEGLKSYSIEYDAVSPAGKETFLMMVTPLADTPPTGAVVMHLDCTERTRAKEALQQSSTLLQAVVNGTPDHIFIKDADGRFLLCNEAMARFVGRHAQQIIGLDQLAVFGHAGSAGLIEVDRLVMETGSVISRESVLTGVAGPRDYYTTKAPYRDSNGEIIGVIGIARDISERKVAEEETQRLSMVLSETNARLEGRVLARTSELNAARVEAEQANRAKSAFLATMSHEIRTPMNGVIGMIDVLHRTALSAAQIGMVDLIHDSADTLLKIIEDILDFSKIEAGKMVLESNPMKLVDVVEKVCGMLAPVARERNVVMTMYVDPTLPIYLAGDELRLRQVLVNLVGNAIKFSGGRERKGSVSVRVVKVEQHDNVMTDPDTPVFVELSVTDDGIGMDEATIARLFAPFSQADASTTRRFGGSGLGLAISGTLVKLMGGHISVRSQPGAGSTFSVRLGFVEPVPWQVMLRPSAWGDSAFGGLDSSFDEAKAVLPILVAEDNETNRKVIMLQLELLGFKAEMAVDGRDALDRWRTGKFSLLLTDLHMPHMDGYALVAAIRSEEKSGERLSIIALTANALRDEELRCLAGGMDAYLSKPVRLPELKTVIESWIGPAALGRHGRPIVSASLAPAHAAPADLDVLRELIGDDPAIIEKVLKAFLLSTVQSAETIDHAVAQGDQQTVIGAAHSLKSAARSIGALRLGDLCADLEIAAHSGNDDEVQALAREFALELDLVRRFLDKD